ncbi:MAG TPA: ribosome small subunit-dependent GTPase A [Rectinemataceae bacterium]|nr:ribosome small subunit-dependent GTPase A [Rectinemataceae bacterium]
MKGLVLSGSNNLFQVACEDGLQRLCAIKGKRLRDLTGSWNSLAAGDRIELEVDALGAAKGLVTALVPRRNVFGRFNEKGQSAQAIAANVDLVVCVSSPRFPPFRPRFIDRVAVLAEAAHVPLLIVLNKSDLGFDEDIEDRLAEYQDLGYEVHVASAGSGEGIGELRDFIDGDCSVFVGQSGVGKSSLINALEPGLLLRTGAVSEKFDRGKHTTTMAVLLPLADGKTWIADTPGMRRLALRGIEPGALIAYFPEMTGLESSCVFGASCTHTHEEGCAVLAALEDGRIHPDRFASYVRIREELVTTAEYARAEGRRTRERRPGNRRPEDWDDE